MIVGGDGGEGPARPGLQEERSGLAWERTGASLLLGGVLLARFATEEAHRLAGLLGVLQALAGAAVLVWAGLRYRALDAAAPQGGVAHPVAARWVGLAAVAATGAALLAGLLAAFDPSDSP